MNFNEIDMLVKSKLSKKRYAHTKAVLKLATELATKYGENIENAMLAAILHDITKEEADEIQLQILKKSDIMVDDIVYKNNNLYHSITAYLFAKNILNINNNDVLNAIYYHTTAREKMSLLEKIIYVADSCAYDRSYSEVEAIRQLCFDNLNKGLIEIIESTIKIIISKKQLIAVDTINCYNFYCQNIS